MLALGLWTALALALAPVTGEPLDAVPAPPEVQQPATAPPEVQQPVPAPPEVQQPATAHVPEPLTVMLVASGRATGRIASALAPRLTEAGFLPVFTRCNDFSCARSPEPGDGLRVVLVFSEDANALVIAVRDDAQRVSVDEAPVAIPRTPLDHEALCDTVLRGLTHSPERPWIDWMRAESLGLHRAPPAAAVEPSEEPAPSSRSPAFRRGGYVELGIGTASALLSEMPLGFAAGLGTGFLFTGRRTERLVIALGVRATNVNRVGTYRYLAPEVRLGVGLSTSRVLGMAHVGIGPGVTYGDGIGPSPSFSASLRGRVSKVVALGVEAGVMMDFVRFTPIVYGLFGPTFTWDVPRRRRATEADRPGEEPRR